MLPDAITQGMSFSADDPQRLASALRMAFDYRGDVTLELLDGRTLEGYIYDRRVRPSPAVRILLREGSAAGQAGNTGDRPDRLLVEDREIARLVISGKDTAAGKSFENWIKRYAEQKLRGENAGIESEPLG